MWTWPSLPSTANGGLVAATSSAVVVAGASTTVATVAGLVVGATVGWLRGASSSHATSSPIAAGASVTAVMRRRAIDAPLCRIMVALPPRTLRSASTCGAPLANGSEVGQRVGLRPTAPDWQEGAWAHPTDASPVHSPGVRLVIAEDEPLL